MGNKILLSVLTHLLTAAVSASKTTTLESLSWVWMAGARKGVEVDPHRYGFSLELGVESLATFRAKWIINNKS